MKRGLQGHYVESSTLGEAVRAYVPAPLPPKPPIDWQSITRELFDQALLALGRLDSASTLLPDVQLFLYMYVRKEAVVSSMIEGTQSSLSDLMLYELDEVPGVPTSDVREVSNYVAALDHGLNRLADGFPLSLRLIREIHEVLLRDGRGGKYSPGEFRTSQNWIGGTRPGNANFVPPPVQELTECLSDLEKFINDQPEKTSTLLKAALAHVQFETIHPFLDGNGRLGRLLITLILCDQGVLKLPLLYISLYFKTHRQQYYDLLNAVRKDGDWEAWLEYFAQAIITTATQATETAKRLHELSLQDRDLISTLGRAASSTLHVHKVFMERPIATSPFIVAQTGISAATVNKSLERLKQLGLVEEMTSQKRNRVFCYGGYIALINEGTELPD